MGRVILALPMGSLNALRRGSAMTVFLLFALLSLLLLVLLVIIDFVLQANTFPGAFAIVVGLAVFFILMQWLISPVIVRWAIRGRQPLTAETNPWVYHTVEELTRQAGVPMPKIWESADGSPNAFVFGRTVASSELVITEGLLERLNQDEIRAVIAHEIGHLRHRDVIIMTLMSAVPLIAYVIACQHNAHGEGHISPSDGFPQRPPTRQRDDGLPVVCAPVAPAPRPPGHHRFRVAGEHLPGGLRDRRRAGGVLHLHAVAHLPRHRPLGDPGSPTYHGRDEPVGLPHCGGAYPPSGRPDAENLGERRRLAERVRVRPHGRVVGTRPHRGPPGAVAPARHPRRRPARARPPGAPRRDHHDPDVRGPPNRVRDRADGIRGAPRRRAGAREGSGAGARDYHPVRGRLVRCVPRGPAPRPLPLADP